MNRPRLSRDLRGAWSIAFCMIGVTIFAIFAPLIYFGPRYPVVRGRSILSVRSNPLDCVWLFALVAFAFAAAPWIRCSNRFSLRTLLIAMTVVAVVLGVWAMRG